MNVWPGMEVAFIGGDRRESEMAVIARDNGANARTHGNPEPRDARGIRRCASLEEALEGTRIAVLPIPLMDSDGTIYAPHAAAPIRMEREHLSLMAPDAHIVVGKANEDLRIAAETAGVTVHEYESDTDLMLLRAPAIAEGAIRVAIERSPFTIHGSPIAVTGFGRIASVLAATLIALKAKVHVIARRPEARAAAYAIGAEAHDFEDIPDLFPQMLILFNTVPARIIGEDQLRHLPKNTLAVDLSAPPGGMDLEAAQRLGLNNFWARGLGASAPSTVARSQWIGVDRLISKVIGG